MKQKLLLFFLFAVQLTFGQTGSQDLLQAANDTLETKNYPGALKLYDQFIQTDGSNAEAFFGRGRTKYWLGDLEGAKRDLESVLKIKPTHLGALVDLASVHAKLMDFDMALMYARKAEEVDSSNEVLLMVKGSIYYVMNKYDLAIPVFTRAILLYPADINLYRLRADCYNFSGKLDSARMDLEYILVTDSNDIYARVNLAFIYIQGKEFAKANKLYVELYQTETNNPYVLSNYGYVKHVLGNSTEGISLIMKSLEIMPGNSYAYKYLAEIYISQGNLQKTCDAIETGLKLGFTASFGPELENMRQKHCK